MFDVHAPGQALEWLHELDVISRNGFFSTTTPHFGQLDFLLSPASASLSDISHSRMDNL
jgi:hypothetical protein